MWQGMKKRTLPRPSRFHKTVLWQVCQLIPTHLVAQLARACGAERRARSFTCWSQVVAMVYAQVAHALSLNDVCDALRLQSGPLSAIRGARPPAKNTLSHANKVRDYRMAEELFWHMLGHLQKIAPAFGQGQRGRGLAHRFRASIQIVDATVIGLVASCMDWAKHRRRKAAAKCHLRLDLHSFLPRMAIVDAGTADATRAAEMCAQLQAGEIVIFDKAYVDFPHLWQLHQRGVFWVSRLAQPMGPQLRAALYLRPLAARGSAKFAATLWDSPRRYPMYRPARSGLVACLEPLACGTARVRTKAIPLL